MGFLTKAKEEVAAKAAIGAIANGQSVFVWVAGSSFSMTGQGLGPMAEQIEAIEAEGWHLEHFSTAWSTTGSNHLVGTCVFRRS
jgi:hypothetical protein